MHKKNIATITIIAISLILVSFFNCAGTKVVKHEAEKAPEKSAEQEAIDKEVAEIMGSEHGTLPQPTITSRSSWGNPVIDVTNQTSYTLTVLYSGSLSKRLILPPHGSGSVKLLPGEYKIAAKVNDPFVIPYAGTTTLLSGAKYSSVFYIITR